MKKHKMNVPVNLTEVQIKAELNRQLEQQNCEHVPANQDLRYDGQETQCIKCKAWLRYGLPGKGKVHMSKKERLKRRLEEQLAKTKVEVVK